MSKKKKVCIVCAVAAALMACAGAVVLFLKRRKKRTYFSLTLTVILCGIMGFTAYATEYSTEQSIIIVDAEDAETLIDVTESETIEVVQGDEIEIDIADFLDFFMNFGGGLFSERTPLTPPGNLTLVDDFSGAQADDKQFITVTTRNGHFFYIIIDRSGERENVHFLNQVDEFDILMLLEDEKIITPADISKSEEVTANVVTPVETEPAQQQSQNNIVGLILMIVLLGAIGGGAYYYFKVRKPKQGEKTIAVLPELHEFQFDPDEDDLFNGGGADEQNNADFNSDDDMPDFTLTYDSDEDSEDNISITADDFDAEMRESEDK